MQQLSKEHTGLFSPLSAKDFILLVNDNDLKVFYLDVLCMMHDMVCSYWDNSYPAVFDDTNNEIDLGIIHSNSILTNFKSLSDHIQENAETAIEISRQGKYYLNDSESIEYMNLKRDATSFVKGLLHTYNFVRSI